VLVGTAAGAALAWWIWPPGITDTPIAQLTLAMMGKAAASIAAPPAGAGLGLIYYRWIVAQDP
jgi:hypothetical protein